VISRIKSRAEQRQNLSPQVIGVDLKRPWSTMTGINRPRASLKPSTRHRLWRNRGDGRNDPEPGRPNKRRALRSRQLEISSDSRERGLPSSMKQAA
jgi:hypothetical protein